MNVPVNEHRHREGVEAKETEIKMLLHFVTFNEVSDLRQEIIKSGF